MATKITEISVKQFSAILNTVFKSRFEKDKSFTIEGLKEQAFGESADISIDGKIFSYNSQNKTRYCPLFVTFFPRSTTNA